MMKACKPHCEFCGEPLISGNVCNECFENLKKCPLHKPMCLARCPYNKVECDYPFIGRIKAEPDKVTE